MKDILIIQRIFPEYRKSIFDAIYKRISFTLLHSENKSSIKQTTASYSVKIKKWQYSSNNTHLFLFVFGKIFKQKPKIVIHELAAGIASLPLVLMLRKLVGYKFILWGHMYDHKSGFYPKHKFMDKYRLWLQHKADAIITYSYGEKQVLIDNGINADKIFSAPNTLDTEKLLLIRNKLLVIGKQKIKDELRFSTTYNLIYIGRLYEDKLPQFLIEILQLLKKKDTSISVAVHFVGSGEMQPKLIQLVEQLNLKPYVFFHGEIYDEEITGKLLFASDIMIMPGCVGLSVNHAFCFDCPVITFRAENHLPAHGPEIEYIVDGETGFQVSYNNLHDMTNVIYQFLQDKEQQLQIKDGVRKMIEKGCSIEQLVQGFSESILFVDKK